MVIADDLEFDDDDVQGDVLPGFRSRRDTSFTQRFLLFKVTGRGAREQLADLAEQVDSGFSLRWEEDGAARPGPFLNVGFTWSGLRAIGLDGSSRAEFEDFDAFRLGLRRHTELVPSLLGDPGDWRWADDEVGAVVNVGGTETESVEAAANDVRTQLDGRGFELIAQQGGSTLPGGKELFGFVDGTSQPLVSRYHEEPSSHAQGAVGAAYPTAREIVAQRELANIEGGEYSAAKKAELIARWQEKWGQQHSTFAALAGTDQRPYVPASQIVVAPRPRERMPRFTDNGSFMVMVRFRQDRKAFDRHCRQIAARLKAEWGRNVTARNVAEMHVGRRKNGTSLIDAPLFTADVARRLTAEQKELFRYAPEDAAGARCPLAAHARKMNPRVNDDLDKAIIRRGIPFDDGDESGLLFVCYQSSIERQFVQLQLYWANQPYAPERNASPDPMISQVARDGKATLEISNLDGRGSTGFKVENTWITPTAGIYAFIPSRRSLRMLAGR